MLFNTKLQLHTSYNLLILLLILHLGALCIIGLVKLPILVKLMLIPLVSLGGYCSIKQHVFLRGRQSIIQFWQERDGSWQLQDFAGTVWSAKLSPNSICTLYGLLLNFKLDNKHKHTAIIILRDALSADEFRRLRVKLNN